jgi:hypothetical protein
VNVTTANRQMLEQPTVLAVNEFFVLARWRNVVLTCFRGNGTGVAEIEQYHQASVELARTHREGIAHLNLVEINESDRQGLPDPVREALLKMLRDPAMNLLASSVVYPGTGFQAALIRGILSGLVIFARPRAPIRFHGSLEDGAKWLAERFSGAATPIDAAALVGAARGILRMKPSAKS